jgi:hypothetical protein
VTLTVHLLQKPFVSRAPQFHMRGPIREAVSHIYRMLGTLSFNSGTARLTNIREVLQDSTLHGQFVEIGIQE